MMKRSALPEPWRPIGTDGAGIIAELDREVGPGHPLFGVRVVPLARRDDRDDVLVALPDPEGSLAEVHLTWSGRRERDPRFPWTTVFASWEEWRERGRESEPG